MSGCSYCGRPNCGIETCPERLEDKFGIPSDYEDGADVRKRADDEDEREVRPDGGRVTAPDDTERWVCQTCGAAYSRKIVGLNGIGSCDCGGTLTQYNRHTKPGEERGGQL